MTIAYWILAGILAAAFLATGLFKLVTSYKDLAAKEPTAWAKDFSPLAVKLIATAEVLGAIGLIAPRLTDILTWLSPVAASALAANMLGATLVHVRRKESLAPTIVLGALSVAAAVLGVATLA